MSTASISKAMPPSNAASSPSWWTNRPWRRPSRSCSGIRTPYEEHHRLVISDEALEAAAHLSARYVTDRFLPDKAIDLIDESSSRVRMYKSPQAKAQKDLMTQLREVRQSHATAEEDGRLDEAQAAADQGKQHQRPAR